MDSIELAKVITWLKQIELSEGLIAACIIGIFVLCGILITQKSKRKREYEAFLRIKFEEVAFRLVDFAAIIQEIQSKSFSSNGDEALAVDEFYREGGKIEILIALYFPELEKKYELFLNAGGNLINAQHEYETNPSDSTLEVLKQFDEEYDRVYKSFYKHIRSCSSHYAKSSKRRKRVLID